MAYATVVDVLLILTRDDYVLLTLRQGTGYADGMWTLPGGKLEQGEHALDAVVREAYEEAGVTLDPGDLRHTGVVHHRDGHGDARLALCFAASFRPERHGHPRNAEPDKHAQVGWHPIDGLPAATFASSVAALDLWRGREAFAAVGWGAADRRA